MFSSCIFDLDNTLWGGVVGERGIYNVDYGDDQPGYSYKLFQKIFLS